jgi:hypothetical protein
LNRRKCKGPLNGPNATGNHCPEGWTIYQYPGPGFEGIGENSAESSYYTWVDQHNTFGLGENIPMSTANLGDGFVALFEGRATRTGKKASRLNTYAHWARCIRCFRMKGKR